VILFGLLFKSHICLFILWSNPLLVFFQSIFLLHFLEILFLLCHVDLFVHLVWLVIEHNEVSKNREERKMSKKKRKRKRKEIDVDLPPTLNPER
jgi:hypothetical protein